MLTFFITKSLREKKSELNFRFLVFFGVFFKVGYLFFGLTLSEMLLFFVDNISFCNEKSRCLTISAHFFVKHIQTVDNAFYINLRRRRKKKRTKNVAKKSSSVFARNLQKQIKKKWQYV